MPTNTWKSRERQVAAFFSAKRTPLSGINSGHTSADVIHKRLFIEQKHRKRHSILTLFRAVKKLARKENKIPVVTLTEHGRQGFWILVHSSDLTAVANQRVKVRESQ